MSARFVTPVWPAWVGDPGELVREAARAARAVERRCAALGSDWSFEDDMAFVLGGLGPVARERWDGLRLCDQMAVWRVLDTGRMEGEFQDVSEEREFLEQVVGVRPARADAV